MCITAQRSKRYLKVQGIQEVPKGPGLRVGGGQADRHANRQTDGQTDRHRTVMSLKTYLHIFVAQILLTFAPFLGIFAPFLRLFAQILRIFAQVLHRFSQI